MSQLRERMYRWRGLDRLGQKCKGEQKAWHSTQLVLLLKDQGIRMTQARPILFKRFARRRKKISRSQKTYFLQQLATLISAGTPLVTALSYLRQHQTQSYMAELITELSHHLEQGYSLAEAFAANQSLAEPLLVSSMAAAEQAGTLDSMLTEITAYRKKLEKLYQAIKKALFYPVLVLSIAACIAFGLLVYVVPAFKQMYESYGATLPFATQMVLSLSAWLKHYFGLGLLLSGGFLLLGVKLIKKNKRMNYYLDVYLLKCYILGPILKQATISRLCYALGLMFSAGVSIVDALPTVNKGIRHLVIQEALTKVHIALISGQSLQAALFEQGQFPPLLIQMIAAGEASGTLDSMLINMANYYAEQVELSVNYLTTLLEPVMMVLLGLLIGGLVIAMYLPIFQLGQVV